MAISTPETWPSILEKNFPYFLYLSEQEKGALLHLVQGFLSDKDFHGFDGLEIDDEVRVTIAGVACILQLHLRSQTMYPHLKSIYIYPTAFKQKTSKWDTEQAPTRLGESWHRGPLVLAWDHSLQGAKNWKDGRNVILHEFAHQLDQELGAADGTPDLGDPARFNRWARILGKKYFKLKNEFERNKRSLMDHYGATSEAEFFAVLTETFFEKPTRLRLKYPKVYRVMSDFYLQDPAALILGETNQALCKPWNVFTERDQRLSLPLKTVSVVLLIGLSIFLLILAIDRLF